MWGSLKCVFCGSGQFLIFLTTLSACVAGVAHTPFLQHPSLPPLSRGGEVTHHPAQTSPAATSLRKVSAVEALHVLPAMAQPTSDSQKHPRARCNTDKSSHGGKCDTKERDASEGARRYRRTSPSQSCSHPHAVDTCSDFYARSLRRSHHLLASS